MGLTVTLVGVAAMAIWLRPAHELILTVHYTGKMPATHLTISDSEVTDWQLERGRHLKCVLRPSREKGIEVSYKCEGKYVYVSTSYVGPGYCGRIMLIIDEEGIVEKEESVSVACLW